MNGLSDFSRERIFRWAGKAGRFGWKLRRQFKASQVRQQREAQYGVETAEAVAAAIVSIRNLRLVLDWAERRRRGAGALLLAGVLAIPLFGLRVVYVGLSFPRNRFIRQTCTKVISDDHPTARTVHTRTGELHPPTRPQVGIYPDQVMNVFAAGLGRRKAVVGFSHGLIDRCTNSELIAIAAHEVARIAINDIRRMQYAWSFQNALTWSMCFDCARAIVRWIVSTIGELPILELSRNRRFGSDATAAALLGPELVIEALRRLDGDGIEPPASKLAYARVMIRPNRRARFFTLHPSTIILSALQGARSTRGLPFMQIKMQSML